MNENDVRVVLTDAAAEVVARVRAARPGDLSLVIGNGCCDSTAPFLIEGYLSGPNEREVAQLDGVRIMLDEAIARSFEGREVVVDAGGDPQPDSFSCESELGYRFFLDRLPAIEEG
ncbi:MAG: DUF779 domain-containing protein [Solirubrobacterales bacterium]